MINPIPPTKKADTDWESIERDYRSGVMTLRAMAAKNGITHGAINKRANKEGWTRDLSAKIAAKTQELVSRALVSTTVSTEAKIADRVVVEANAEMQKDIILSHRTDAVRGRKLAGKLFEELELMTDNRELFSQVAEILAGDEGTSDRMLDLFRKTVGHQSRVQSMKSLAETLKTLIGIERQAFGIGEDSNGSGGSIESLINEIEREEAGA